MSWRLSDYTGNIKPAPGYFAAKLERDPSPGYSQAQQACSAWWKTASRKSATEIARDRIRWQLLRGA